MKQLSRHQAEALFVTSQVIASNIEHDQKEMRVLLTLANNSNFLIKYNLMDHNKSYYIQE